MKRTWVVTLYFVSTRVKEGWPIVREYSIETRTNKEPNYNYMITNTLDLKCVGAICEETTNLTIKDWKSPYSKEKREKAIENLKQFKGKEYVDAR